MIGYVDITVDITKMTMLLFRQNESCHHVNITNGYDYVDIMNGYVDKTNGSVDITKVTSYKLSFVWLFYASVSSI